MNGNRSISLLEASVNYDCGPHLGGLQLVRTDKLTPDLNRLYAPPHAERNQTGNRSNILGLVILEVICLVSEMPSKTSDTKTASVAPSRAAAEHSSTRSRPIVDHRGLKKVDGKRSLLEAGVMLGGGLAVGAKSAPAALGFRQLYAATKPERVAGILSGGFDPKRGGTGASAKNAELKAGAQGNIYLANKPTATIYSHIIQNAKKSPVFADAGFAFQKNKGSSILKAILPEVKFANEFTKDADNRLKYLVTKVGVFGSAQYPLLNQAYKSPTLVPSSSVVGGKGFSYLGVAKEIAKDLPRSIAKNPFRFMRGSAGLGVGSALAFTGLKRIVTYTDPSRQETRTRTHANP